MPNRDTQPVDQSPVLIYSPDSLWKNHHHHHRPRQQQQQQQRQGQQQPQVIPGSVLPKSSGCLTAPRSTCPMPGNSNPQSRGFSSKNSANKASNDGDMEPGRSCSIGSSSCSLRPPMIFSPPRSLLLLLLLLAPSSLPVWPQKGRVWTRRLRSEIMLSICGLAGSQAPHEPQLRDFCYMHPCNPTALAVSPRPVWRRRAHGTLLLAAAAASPAVEGLVASPATRGAATAVGDGGSGTSWSISGLLPGSDKGNLLMRPSFDASLDWASNVTAKGKEGCTLAKNASKPAFMPPRCPKPQRPVGIDEARKLGWRFAPLLHQHSLDWSRLSDPGPWLESAVLVDPVTYTTTDLKTYLENRHRARRAKTEKVVAEAAAAAAAAAATAASVLASAGGSAQAYGVEAAAAKAAAAAAEAAAEDPYWLIHEAYDTHNFFATRLVRRRDGSAPSRAAGAAAAHGREAQQQPAAAQTSGAAASAETGGGPERTGQVQPAQPSKTYQQPAGNGRRTMAIGSTGRRRHQQELGSGSVRQVGGEASGDSSEGQDDGMESPDQDQDDPFWPHFEVLQGSEFFEAIAGDPFNEEDGEGQDQGKGGSEGKARRREAVEKGSDGGGPGKGNPSRLGGKVYFTVFEPRLEHLHWTRPGRYTGSSPGSDTGPPAGNNGEPTYAYVYTFWFFYPFNGCSNQLMATRFAGRHQAAEYFLCPLGVHEGDWEHLKVYVCQDGMLDEQEPARAIAALQYSQHTWLPSYDCTTNGTWTGAKGNWPGNCSFEKDPDNGQMRPRVYSGLHSHANSPHTSNLNVYAKVNFKQLLNFDGIYVADRFAQGGPLFVPSSTNTLWLPFQHEMGDAEGVRPEDIRPGGRLAWTSYMGNWGVPLTSPNFSITCLTHNLTAGAPCDPRNPPVFILDRLLGGVGVKPVDMNWTAVLSPKRVAPELAEPISGPLVRRAAAYSWERELAAPLWDAREPLPGLGGLSLATIARDTSSLACPLAEDVHRTSAWGAGHYLGNDPRVAHRLRLFVAAATAAIVAAAALSALVVKCMPLILAPYHKSQHHHHHHHHHGYGYGGEPYGSRHERRRGDGGGADEEVSLPPLHGPSQTFGLVYGKYDESLFEPLPQPLHEVGYGATTSAPYRQQGRPAPMRREMDVRDSGGGGGDGGGSGGDGGDDDSRSSGSESSSERYSGFASTAVSGSEPTNTAPSLREPDGRQLPYEALEHPLSCDVRKIKPGQGSSACGMPQNPQLATSRFSESGAGGGAAAIPAHHRSSEEQPLLANALNRSRRCGGGNDGGVGVDDNNNNNDDDNDSLISDDDDGDKPRRTVRRGWRSFILRSTAACPAANLVPLLAWRYCRAASRYLCKALCFPCRLCLPGGDGGDASGGNGSNIAPHRRRRRRGLGPYLLGCATQPERRLLWLSLGIMAYSLGLIMSVQGLLETLHALRNLLLRGLWAIAGLEGVFVALLAAGGVTELALMVAAVSLGPKLQVLQHPSIRARPAPPTDGTPLGIATSTEALDTTYVGGGVGGGAGGGGGGGASTLPLLTGTTSAALGGSFPPLLPLSAKSSGAANSLTLSSMVPPLALGSRSASGGGAGSDWEFYGLSHPHIHFPSSAAVAATAAAATAAATAAASAAATAAATAAAKVPWRTLALLAAVGYMEVAASLHLLGFGLALWVGVLGASEGCSAAVQGLYRVISFSPDVCLDLSVIGVPGPRCGGDLMQMCNVWRQLRLSGLLYGSLLIIAARLLLLIMATANYHSRHAVLLPLPQQHHHGHHHGHHHNGPHAHNHQYNYSHNHQRHPLQNGNGTTSRTVGHRVEMVGAGGSRRRRVHTGRMGTMGAEKAAAEAIASESDGEAAGAQGTLHRREGGQETRRRRPPGGWEPGIGEAPVPGATDGSGVQGVRPRHPRRGSIPPDRSGAHHGRDRDEGKGGVNGAAEPGTASARGGSSGSGVLPVSAPAGIGPEAGEVVLEMGSVATAGGTGSCGNDTGSSSRSRGWGLFGF
ncbi:hypothetical protein VaNZ11_006694 [Volvox africanus]|uniref:Uncharacterized protein n=1 Tax=Volvox africanus TaxID=51714 RepID=A0ABQ5S194_9CHLO|nr:hypothetical protein VaNZ11_006694 [Volvox africanus]